MKKLTFTLLASIGFFSATFAQSQPCGSSGAAVCSVATPLNYNGFEYYNDLECFESGVNDEVIVRFKNFNNLTIPGTGAVTVYFLKIDGFGNLPCGVCWATNKSNNVFAGGESGCIKFSGLTTDADGQYKIMLEARAQITPGNYNEQALVTPPGGISSYENDIPNLRLYLRVKANGSSACANADSTKPSKVASSACTGVGINEAASTVSGLRISPSPFNAASSVTFAATESGSATAFITDITGKNVWVKEVETTSGENTILIERGNLSSGIYFFSVRKNGTVATQRFSITD